MNLRGFLTVLLACVLSGCWVSEEVLFGPEDYAKVDLRGQYKLDLVRHETAEIESHIFKPQPDGRVKSVLTYKTSDEFKELTGDEPLQAISYEYYIAIPDAPNGWYLTFAEDELGERDPNYFITSLDDERILKVFAPDCRATKERRGLERALIDEERGLFGCKFETKEALLAAAKDAVDFLTKPQPVLVEPWIALRPVYEWEDDFIGEPAE